MGWPPLGSAIYPDINSSRLPACKGNCRPPGPSKKPLATSENDDLHIARRHLEDVKHPLRGDKRAQDAYGASKGAILSLSRSLAIQFARDRIRSNVILPGGTLTPMQERWRGHEAEIARGIPLGRIGTCQDQSSACLFLLSDKASYITGTELVVDGGVNADA